MRPFVNNLVCKSQSLIMLFNEDFKKSGDRVLGGRILLYEIRILIPTHQKPGRFYCCGTVLLFLKSLHDRLLSVQSWVRFTEEVVGFGDLKKDKSFQLLV